ncbi:MAG: hypothetical protein LIP09_04020 [Bacteroidales bacterium]|nr:hypothetical protein [Bacteroidales bacterium]
MTAFEMRALLLNDIDSLIQDDSTFLRLKKYVARLKKERKEATARKRIMADLNQMCEEIKQARAGKLQSQDALEFINEL